MSKFIPFSGVRNLFAVSVLVFLAVVNLVLTIHDLAPAGSTFGPGQSLLKAHDFLLRRNEARCVLEGVDPYLVWTQQVVHEPYYPYVKTELRTERFNEPINAYTPWEYPYAFVYAVLPKQGAWALHVVLTLAALALVALFALRCGGPWSAAAVLVFFIPLNIDINVGNYPMIITAAVVGMIVFLRRGWQCAAGLCWAVAMFKPQLGILLAVPLLMKFRVKTCVTAGVLCCVLTVPAAILTGVSPLTLIREAPAASAHAFEGCALMPKPLLNIVQNLAPADCWMALAMMLGLAVCVVLTWRLRGNDDWFVLTLPSVLCAIGWTYVQPHSFLLVMPLAAWVAKDVCAHGGFCRMALGTLVVFLLAGFVRGTEIVIGKVLPAFMAAASCATSLSATVAFALAVIYLWRYAAADVANGRTTDRTSL